MTSSGNQPVAWEYGDRTDVGQGMPVAGEPREEEAPGVPRARESASDGAPAVASADGALEEREVRAADPELSPETNARLTAELREVVGTEKVRVPKGRPHASQGELPEQQGTFAYMSMHRFQLIRTFAIVLTFGAVVALATGKWWLLPLAAGVHALGTMTVLLTSIRMTTISEHPSPAVAAALSEEGVSSPDEHFSKMVDEFRAEPENGTSEVISPGHNERTVEASQDTAQAGAEQSSAMTPTAQPSTPARPGDAPDRVIWATAFSLLILSLVLPAVGGGGWMWLLPAVMIPALAGWVLLQRGLVTREEGAQVSRTSMTAIVACTAIAVAIFAAVVALALPH
jgi:hypothetical protein